MDKQTKQQEILQRLHNLADQPSTQARYALELLDQERGNQVVSAALDIVTAADTPEARPVLLRLYDYYDASGIKRDADSYLRSAILGALLPIADPADWTLAEQATKTYEFCPTPDAMMKFNNQNRSCYAEPFASLRVTWCDGSNCQVLCFTIGPCLRSEMFKL